MKYLRILMALLFVSCTSYQTSSIREGKVMVAKNVNILHLIQFGDVFTCQVNDTGVMTSCIKNDVSALALAEERRSREPKVLYHRDETPMLINEPNSERQTPHPSRRSRDYHDDTKNL